MTKRESFDPALLTRVLQDPLGLDSAHHVREWMQSLKAHVPLWSFQAWAYKGLHRRAKAQALGKPAWREKSALSWPYALPTAYPLQVIVDAVVADEGLRDSQHLTALEHCVDVRRTRLADWHALTSPSDPDWSPKRQPFPPEFTSFSAREKALEIDAASEYDTADPSPYQSPYEGIGELFVKYVEDWIAARDKSERKKRRRKVNRLPNRVAAELGVVVKKKLPEGPRLDVLQALVAQGKLLAEVCWDVFPVTVSEDTAAVFAEQGVRDSVEQQVWAVRLAFPVLSRREIEALKVYCASGASWRRGLGRHRKPTPRLFAVWILGRRLGLNARSLARKVLGGDAYTHFIARRDPFSA